MFYFHTKGTGRRKIDIDGDELLKMKESCMSYDDMAKELGISKSTIQRRFNVLVSNGVKTQNLTVNDNGNDTGNGNDNENENDKPAIDFSSFGKKMNGGTYEDENYYFSRLGF